jgi:hypothetical protein
VADCFSATAWNRIQASQPTRRYKWAIAAIWSEISTELNTLLRDHVLISFNFFLVDGCSALTDLTAFSADDKSFLIVTASDC